MTNLQPLAPPLSPVTACRGTAASCYHQGVVVGASGTLMIIVVLLATFAMTRLAVLGIHRLYTSLRRLVHKRRHRQGGLL